VFRSAPRPACQLSQGFIHFGDVDRFDEMGVKSCGGRPLAITLLTVPSQRDKRDMAPAVLPPQPRRKFPPVDHGEPEIEHGHVWDGAGSHLEGERGIRGDRHVMAQGGSSTNST
jgi:hypothetical protein